METQDANARILDLLTRCGAMPSSRGSVRMTFLLTTDMVTCLLARWVYGRDVDMTLLPNLPTRNLVSD